MGSMKITRSRARLKAPDTVMLVLLLTQWPGIDGSHIFSRGMHCTISIVIPSKMLVYWTTMDISILYSEIVEGADDHEGDC